MYILVNSDTGKIQAVYRCDKYEIKDGRYYFKSGATKDTLGKNQKLIVIPEQKFTEDEEGNIIEKYPDDVETQFSQPFLDSSSTYYAKISNINVNKQDKKYIEVKRVIEEQELKAWCYVTNSILTAYQNNKIANGDYVIVQFVDNDLDKPVVMDKIVGF